MMNLRILGLLGVFLNVSSFAADPMIRWTGTEDSNASFSHILELIQVKTGKAFVENDFLLLEDRDLGFTHYQRFEQINQGVPVDGKAIRIWTDLGTHANVQVEASLDLAAPHGSLTESFTKRNVKMTEVETMNLVRNALKSLDEDKSIRGIDWKDRFVNGKLSRIVTVKGTRGKTKITISADTKKVSSSEFQEFPQSDTLEFPAQVYPVYEEVEGAGTILSRQTVQLSHILKQVPQMNGDIYASLRTNHYYDYQYSPILGETAAGRAQGFWSMHFIKSEAAKIRASLPLADNSFNQGLLLQGEYATINIHPDAFKVFKGINFKANPSTALYPNWIETTVNGQAVTEMIPETAFSGKTIASADDLFNRPARRLPDNDPATLMNDGFDEIQVYYAINTLMEELKVRGFTDPDLSTRPFNAFLFNPDISYRNNAFYTDDTINFTTYTPDQPNMARDNSTIWHELGHGVMDRLMGDNLQLADTGGLSEGMADFVAAMVVRAVTQGTAFPGSNEFRIINQTGFFLTNEVHDDGESYGGAMKDFLDAATQKSGQVGLAKVADLILEAMRLCRDHPALTAMDWFDHIIFADSLGRPGVRAPGELAPLLIAAVSGRNFKLKGGKTAALTLMNETTKKEVVAGAEGSRNSPMKLNLAKNATAHVDLSVKLESSDEYHFQYPLTVRVTYAKSPLQGAVHWLGKEKGPTLFTMNSEADLIKIPLDISGTCDYSNRPDGTCVDYVHVQVLNTGETDHPRAKKRFYVQIKNP